MEQKHFNCLILSILILTTLTTNTIAEPSQKTGETKITKDTTKNTAQKVGSVLPEQQSDIVTINTDKGIIKIKLFTKEAPITSNNFLDLVKKGFYNGTVFHRVVENFVIQGGDPLGDGTGNYIDPENGKPRFIKLETNPNLKFDRPGRLGMARTASPNTASCQFFIALDKLPSLDPGGVDSYGYAVFGQVTDDTFETVKKIASEFKPIYPGSDKPSNPVKMKLVASP